MKLDFEQLSTKIRLAIPLGINEGPLMLRLAQLVREDWAKQGTATEELIKIMRAWDKSEGLD